VEVTLSISLHEISVGVYVPYLTNLAGLLDRASAYATDKKVDPAVLLALRLAPNMYSLRQQVEEVCRHAILSCALLAGRDPLSFLSAGESDIAELKSRIAATINFVQSLRPEEIDATADKEIIFTFKNGTTRAFTGRSLLLTFSLPQFFFHMTTAYDILRHAGVDLVKKDFLGPPPSP
jgi:hypothetical protein